MNESAEAHNGLMTSWTDVPTRRLSAGGVEFAYRQLGPGTGVPVVFLTHLAAVLDNWDPRVVDGIAATHRVITFDNRGVGASTGSTPATIEEMARDAVTFIRALGFDQVDLFGFSMGGMIAQVIAQEEPQLVRKMILSGTGPAGGEGIDKVTRITYLDTARAPMGSAEARRPRGHPPAGARHERRERQDGALQEHRRPRPAAPRQPARPLSRRRARRGVPVPRGLRRAGAGVSLRAPAPPHTPQAVGRSPRGWQD